MEHYTFSDFFQSLTVKLRNAACSGTNTLRGESSIGLISRVFANSPGDQRSIPGRVIPKTQKMVLDSASLSTQNYNLRIKGKVEQSREWSSAFPYTSVE